MDPGRRRHLSILWWECFVALALIVAGLGWFVLRVADRWGCFLGGLGYLAIFLAAFVCYHGMRQVERQLESAEVAPPDVPPAGEAGGRSPPGGPDGPSARGRPPA